MAQSLFSSCFSCLRERRGGKNEFCYERHLSVEIGHASGALPKYSADAMPVGSAINPFSAQAEPGTTMEANVSVEVLGENVRGFSDEDKEKLRQVLNDP